MKNRYVTCVCAATLLGVYSASIYQFSLDKIQQPEHQDIPVMLSPDAREADKRRILDVVRVQEFVTVESNIPIPGAECEFNLGEIESQEFIMDLSTCLESHKE